MLRVYRKILALPLIFSFFFVSIICCCSSQSAHAEDSDHHIKHAVQTSKSGHCESHNPQEHHSEKNHNCECPKILGTLAKNIDILKLAEVVFHSFNHQIVLDKIFLAFVLDSYNSFIGPSPPQFASSSIPLYIKNPTLRI